MEYGYVTACSQSICWNHDGANDHDSEWSHSDAPHGRGLMDLDRSAGSMGDPHQVLAQDLYFFSRRNLGIPLIQILR